MIYLYILLSYLLSLIGFLVYRYIIKDRITPKQRKIYIYSFIVLSLSLPWVFTQSPDLMFTDQYSTITEPDDFVNEPVLDEALKACYDKVSSQEGLCHCEQLQQSNLLYYTPNPFYNFLIQNKVTIQIISISISIIVLLSLILKILYLSYLISTSQQQIIRIENCDYRILRRKGSFLAASFRLWHSYILWHPSLDELSGSEQNAILMHEISHIKNGDTFEQIGLIFLQILWLVNPIYYFIKKELALLNEYIADEFALLKTGNRHSYATLLVKLKERQTLFLGQHFGGDALKSRVVAILNPKQFIYMRYMPMIVVGVTALMLTLAASTAPMMTKQYALYEEYCVMHNEHDKTGKMIFCRPCLYQDLLKERSNMSALKWKQPVVLEHEH
jgi:hypothetical protein